MPDPALPRSPNRTSPKNRTPPKTSHRTRNRLTVAVLGPSRYPVAEPYAGGLESFVGGLVTGLRDRGHRVLLFAAAGSHGAQPELLSGGGWRPDELSRRDPSMPSEAFMVEHHAHLSVLDALRTTYADEVDVVHNNSLHYLPLSLSSTLPAPMVTTFHTPPTPWLTSALSAGGGSEVFTSVSGFTGRQWAPWAPQPTVVPNGVDPRRWRFGPGGDGLLWVGRLVPEKAPHLALDAAARTGHHLHLVGPALDEGYFAAQIAPRLGTAATWHGHLGGRDLVEAVRRADAVLVTPVWDEPFGLVAAEAAMCGTPVVAFDRGGIAEVLRPATDAPLGFVVPSDDEQTAVQGMAEAIAPALTANRRSLRAAAVRHLSLDTMVTRYEDLFRAVAARGSASDQVRVVAS